MTPEYGPQHPDPRPGCYYVSAIDGKRKALLLGPYPTHEAALERVDLARRKLHELCQWRSHWWLYGTARLPADYPRDVPVGSLHRYAPEID